MNSQPENYKSKYPYLLCNFNRHMSNFCHIFLLQLSHKTCLSNLMHFQIKWIVYFSCKGKYWEAWRQKIAILIRMKFLNDIIKSRHGFKAAHKFRVLIKFDKILNLWYFWAALKPCLDLMMSFKNCIRIRIAIFWRPVIIYLRDIRTYTI